jgi:hypothetical protein
MMATLTGRVLLAAGALRRSLAKVDRQSIHEFSLFAVSYAFVGRIWVGDRQLQRSFATFELRSVAYVFIV